MKKNFLSGRSDESLLDASVITCAEYQLFIDEMLARNKYFQPDHWFGSHFPEGIGSEPVVGVRFKDAKAFCLWLRQSRGEKFRLPRNGEKLHAVNMAQTTPGFWMEDKSIGGLTEEREAIIKQELTKEILLPAPPTLECILDCDRTHSLPIERALNRDFAHSRALTRCITFTLDRVLDRDRYRASKRTLASTSERDLHRDRVLSRTPECDYSSDNDLARNHSIWEYTMTIMLGVSNAINHADIETAKAILKTKDINSLSQFFIPFFSQLSEIVNKAEPHSIIHSRSIFRRCLLILLEYSHHIYAKLINGEQPWWHKLRFKNSKSYMEKEQQILLDLYWFHRTILLREEGKLPAWEGILIVREKKS